jgi:hypothetical protein
MATTQANPTTAVFDTAASANSYATPRTAQRALAAALRRHGLRQIRVGAVSFIIGLVITVVTFQHPVGGIFVAAYGPMIFGAISMVRGIATVSRSLKLR